MKSTILNFQLSAIKLSVVGKYEVGFLFADKGIPSLHLSQNVFTCDRCGKSLKTERGFKRHKQKHEEKQAESTTAQLFDVDVWKQLIQKSINKVVEVDLQYGNILEELKAFSLTSSDAERCLPHFIQGISSVCNSENFYPKFYKAVTQLETICG